jgi:hypothetical protein
VILGLDSPVVVLEGRVAAMLARPLERLVADARRRGEQVEESVLTALSDCERVRRLLAAGRVPAAEPAEPVSEGGRVVPVAHETLSTSAAAELVGCSTSYLRRRARERHLGVKVGTGWRFSPGDLAILVEDRAAPSHRAEAVRS